MDNLTINLYKDRKKPLYDQIYRHISGEIRSGNLKAGEKLPSKRALASNLSVSMNTVETAYAMLMQEGYIISRPKSGFYVQGIELPKADDDPQSGEHAEISETEYRWDFRTGAVDTASFPYKTWAKLSREVLITGQDLLSRGDFQGDLCLRESIARYLREYRGVRCRPSQIVVGAGIEYLLILISGLFDWDRVFALEDPGYRKTAGVLIGENRKVVSIPLDKDGMDVDFLGRSGGDIAYITPSHQFPTGIIMPIGRRMEILKWAGEKDGRYIIEDDFSSEFNFSGKPIPSVQGEDTQGKVIYMSTFSRILAPSIRIAYMVLPDSLMDRFKERYSGYTSTVSRFEQHTLCRFIDGGHLSRHINRVKNVYKKRRETMLGELKKYGMSISGFGAGLHVLIKPEADQRQRLLENAAEHRIRVYELKNYYNEPGHGDDRTLILGYAGMDSGEIVKALGLLFAPSEEAAL